MLSFSTFQSQLGEKSKNYFEGSFEKGPRIASPFPLPTSERIVKRGNECTKAPWEQELH